jgi:UDP-N-acetylglucosamine diphosphorylase/glucosamine-1-phosphate N-acetyltransferase
MAQKLFIFEDHKYAQFFPLTYNRPVYELLCGMTKIKDKIRSQFPEAEVVLLCREYLEKVLKEKTGQKINDFDVSDQDQILLVNGRILPSEDFLQEIDFSSEEKLFLQGENMIGWTGRGEAFKHRQSTFQSLFAKEKIESLKTEIKGRNVEVKSVNYLWDLISSNASEIEVDFKRAEPRLDFKNMFKHNQVDDDALIYDLDKVYVGKDARIDGHVVLDARNGPIFISDGVRIQAHTRLEGSCYVGRDSFLVGGKIREGTSIGPVCRIGGEVENSIFLGYSNKYHEGFLGHSYVGEWVNLGALTTNSDLKNNYGSIKVMVDGSLIDTGFSKVGAFLGDHVKTGIGTLLNTGISIGFSSNLFGGGMINQRQIPAFFWGSTEAEKEYKLDKAVQTAQAVMKRRKKELSKEEADLFKKIFQLTEKEREKK